MEKDAQQPTNYSRTQWNYNFENGVPQSSTVYKYRQEGTATVYVVETYVSLSHYTMSAAVQTPLNKDQRLIILHAGEIKVLQNTMWKKLNMEFKVLWWRSDMLIKNRIVP